MHDKFTVAFNKRFIIARDREKNIIVRNQCFRTGFVMDYVCKRFLINHYFLNFV